MHGDQTHGINDLRSFFIKNKKPINVYADYITSRYLKKTFSYCFTNNNKDYPATLRLNIINKDLLIKHLDRNINVKAIKVEHGKVQSICYIIQKKLAYISDVSMILNKDFKYFN